MEVEAKEMRYPRGRIMGFGGRLVTGAEKEEEPRSIPRFLARGTG